MVSTSWLSLRKYGQAREAGRVSEPWVSNVERVGKGEGLETVLGRKGGPLKQRTSLECGVLEAECGLLIKEKVSNMSTTSLVF